MTPGGARGKRLADGGPLGRRVGHHGKLEGTSRFFDLLAKYVVFDQASALLSVHLNVRAEHIPLRAGASAHAQEIASGRPAHSRVCRDGSARDVQLRGAHGCIVVWS